MKSMFTKHIAFIFILVIGTPLHAADILKSVPMRPLQVHDVDTGLISSTQGIGMEEDKKVKILKEKSFYLEKEGIRVIPAEVLSKSLPHGNECLLYVTNNHGGASLFNMSSKSDRLWICVGEPIFSVMRINNKDGGTLILAMYLFQAPSGDFFHLPLVIEISKEGTIAIGKVDKCIEKKLDGTTVESLAELASIARQCLVRN